MRLFDLDAPALAEIVEEAYLADQGEFSGRSASDFDTLQQLRGHLSGRPALAGEVLDLWLARIQGEHAEDLRNEAEDWYDHVLLGQVRGLSTIN